MEIFSRNIPVLDLGFVKYVKHLGNDEFIVQAARISYKHGKKLRDDRNLIDFLISEGHTSPFEMCEIVYHIKAPIFVLRQLMRHRTASVNEISGRYTELKEEFYIPEKLRGQDLLNKQMSVEKEIEDEDKLIEKISSITKECYNLYLELLSKGVAREQARIVLPLSLYSEIYFKIDLNNLMKLLNNRMKPEAQYETRLFAEAMYYIAKELFPWTMESWNNHVFFAEKFSLEEKQSISEKKLVSKKELESLLPKGKHYSERYKNKLLQKLSRFFGVNYGDDNS